MVTQLNARKNPGVPGDQFGVQMEFLSYATLQTWIGYWHDDGRIIIWFKILTQTVQSLAPPFPKVDKKIEFKYQIKNNNT